MSNKQLLKEIDFDFDQDSDVLGSFAEDSLFERMTSKPLSDNLGNELKEISASNSMSDSSSDFTINSLFDGCTNPIVYDPPPKRNIKRDPIGTTGFRPTSSTDSVNRVNTFNPSLSHQETSLPTKSTFLSQPKHLSQNINSINIPSTTYNNNNNNNIKNLEEIKKYKEDIENYEMRLKEYENSMERIQDELSEYRSKETQWNIKEAELENNIREKESIINELKSENSNQAITQAQLEKEKENCLLTKELQYNKDIEEIKSKYESQINQLQTEIRIKEFECKNELNTQRQEYEEQILELQNRCTNEMNIQSNDNETDIEYQSKLHELEEKNNEMECELCKMKIEYDNKVNEVAHLKNKVNNNEINYNKLMELYNTSITDMKNEIRKYLQQISEYKKEINLKDMEINDYKEEIKKVQSYNYVLIDKNKDYDRRLEEIMKLKLEIEKMRNNEEVRINLHQLESGKNSEEIGKYVELIEKLKYENLQLKKDLVEIKNKFKKMKESVFEKVKEFRKTT